MNKVDDAWIKAHAGEMTESVAKFLLSAHEGGKFNDPLSPEAVEILRRAAGTLPPEPSGPPAPKPPPPPFIIDGKSQGAGERQEF